MNAMTLKELADGMTDDQKREEDYRRGYRDGFIAATEATMHQLEKCSRFEAYNLLWAHWEGPLAYWQARASLGHMEMPPEVRAPR